MDKWKRTWTVFLDTWAECISSLAFYASLLLIMFVSGVLIYDRYATMYPFVGKFIVPEVIVNVLNGPFEYFFMIGGIFIYLMRAPYFCQADAYLLPRLGRGPWIWGKIIFIVSYILLALVLTFSFTVLLCAPFIDFARWTWTPDFIAQHYLGESLPKVMPGVILLQTFGLNFVCLLFIALLTMVFNLCYSRIVSVIIVGGVCAVSTAIEFTFPNQIRWGLTLQASMYYHRFEGIDNIMGDASKALPTVPESLLLFAAGCILCLILIRYRVRNYDFQLESKGMH